MSNFNVVMHRVFDPMYAIVEKDGRSERVKSHLFLGDRVKPARIRNDVMLHMKRKLR